jgi:hypothetical protein
LPWVGKSTHNINPRRTKLKIYSLKKKLKSVKSWESNQSINRLSWLGLSRSEWFWRQHHQQRNWISFSDLTLRGTMEHFVKNLSFKAAPFSWLRNHIYTLFYTSIYIPARGLMVIYFNPLGGKFENFEYFLALFF